MRKKLLDGNFIASINALEKAIDKKLDDRVLTALEMSMSEVHVLLCISKFGVMSVTSLGQRASFDRSQTSRIVSALEKRGLVEKARNAADARGLVIKLTQRGDEIYRRSIDILCGSNNEILSVLEDSERSVLDRALDKILAQVGASAAN